MDVSKNNSINKTDKILNLIEELRDNLGDYTLSFDKDIANMSESDIESLTFLVDITKVASTRKYDELLTDFNRLRDDYRSAVELLDDIYAEVRPEISRINEDAGCTIFNPCATETVDMVKTLPSRTVCLEETAKSSKLKWSEQEILRLAEEEHSNFPEYKEGE